MNQTKIIKTSRLEKVCVLMKTTIKGTSLYNLSKHIFSTGKH